MYPPHPEPHEPSPCPNTLFFSTCFHIILRYLPSVFNKQLDIWRLCRWKQKTQQPTQWLSIADRPCVMSAEPLNILIVLIKLSLHNFHRYAHVIVKISFTCLQCLFTSFEAVQFYSDLVCRWLTHNKWNNPRQKNCTGTWSLVYFMK